MEQFTINLLFVGASFALYIGIAIWARAGSTSEFYAAGRGVHPVTNGMATAADWMSAASFISMAGLIAFTGYDNSDLPDGLDRRLCAAGAAARTLPAQVRQVHRVRIHRRPLLQPDRAGRRGDLSDRGLDHLRDRADDRRGRGLRALPRGRQHHRPSDRRRGGFRLRGFRRHEGRDLYAGRAICGADHGLYDPGGLHLAATDRQRRSRRSACSARPPEPVARAACIC